MCGIAGFWQPGAGAGDAVLRQRARTMAGALSHRGPDDEGQWVEPAIDLAFGHRRLSIIDLSREGRSR